MSLLGAIVLSAAGTAIATYFQNRQQKNNHLMALRQRELDTADEIFKTVSKNMDRLLYTMWQIYHCYNHHMDRGSLEQRWKDYRDIYTIWESTLNLESARIRQYFGLKMANTFKYGIWKSFLTMRRELDILYYADFVADKSGKTGNTDSSAPNYNPGEVQRLMDRMTKTEEGDTLFYITALKTRPAIEKFNVEMIEMIQHEDVGILKDMPYLAHSHGRNCDHDDHPES